MNLLKIAIADSTKSDSVKQHLLAQALKLPIVSTDWEQYDYLLTIENTILSIHSIKHRFKPYSIDFTMGRNAFRRQHGGGFKQLIAKAVGIKPQDPVTILDGTAGFGQDAFVLASLGANVTMLEKNPIIAALLENGLSRLHQTSTSISLTLIQTDSLLYLKEFPSHLYPEIIYLDPMYPERPRRAAVKKEMQLIQALTEHDDPRILLEQSLKVAKKRVVVKRPSWAPPLIDILPTTDLKGKTTRYDLYFTS